MASIRPLLKLLSRSVPGRVKTPTLLQMEAAECGAAALGIILAYYRHFVTLAELRRECGVSRDGSRASNIVRAARYYGLEAKGFTKELDELRALRPPYIVFWNFNHFVVVEGFRKNRVYLNDPGTGPRSVSNEEFDEGYTGLVLVLEPGPKFRPSGRKSSVITALRERLHGSVGALLACMFLGFLLVLPGLAVPAFTQVFIDNVLIQEMDDWLRPLLLGMLLTASFRTVFLRLQLAYLRRLKIKISVAASSRFVWHILRLPVGFYSQRYSGEVSSRTALNDRVGEILSGRLATTVIDATMMVFYALAMLQYDVVLSATGIAIAGVNFAALRWIARERVDANIRLSQEAGKVNGLSIAALQNIEVLKASALESDFFARYAGTYAKTVNAQQELGIATLKLGLFPTVLSAAATMLVLVVGALRVMGGMLTIGMLVAFQSLMQSFLTPINNLVGLGTTLQDLQADLHRLDDVLRNPIDPEAMRGDAILPAGTVSPRLKGHVELRNVTFGYNRAAPPLIEHFSLTIQPGERVALVGASGSGKSTVVKLLCGLYDPWEGEIFLDGKPRVKIPRQVLTNSIAMVEQDVFLFEGTVRDNLTLWDATIPEENLMRACGDAAIHEVVCLLPGGYDSHLLEGGANLSGGQRQRLEIARALVNDPAIVVADEATSALDAETERIIDQNLRRRGCSCLVVAHRLSTIRDCDEIIVLQRGKVAQRGRHEALRQSEGVYAGLLVGEGGAIQEA